MSAFEEWARKNAIGNHADRRLWEACWRAAITRAAEIARGMKVKPAFSSNNVPLAESGFNEACHEIARAIEKERDHP